MKNAAVIFIIFLYSQVIKAQSLDIPRITVFGKRSISIKPVKKSELPFEKNPASPAIVRTKAESPELNIKESIEKNNNAGFYARINAGTEFGEKFTCFIRNNYHPLEAGMILTQKTSIKPEIPLSVYLKNNIEDFYVSLNYMKLESESNSHFSAVDLSYSSYYIDASINAGYIDSILYSGNATVYYENIAAEINVSNNTPTALKGYFNRNTLKAGISYYDGRIFPEIFYMHSENLPFWTKSSLNNYDNIYSRIPGSSCPGLLRKISLSKQYRFEIGTNYKFPVSIFYNDPLELDSMNFAGAGLKLPFLSLEVGFPLKKGKIYLQAASFIEFNRYLNLMIKYCTTETLDKSFIFTDIGYKLYPGLKLGLTGEVYKDFTEITGYVRYQLF